MASDRESQKALKLLCSILYDIYYILMIFLAFIVGNALLGPLEIYLFSSKTLN